ncbi:F0F1 ATP synthase subunit A [Chloroflexota bacterium]
MAKRRYLGLSLPVLVGFLLLFLALFAVGFAGGPLGKSMFGDLGLPGWLSVPQPHPELPAEVVFHLFGFPITNSVVAAWITIIFLVGFSYAVTRKMKLIPNRLQAALELLLGWLYDFCQSVAGEKNGRLFFPVVATIFLFVAFNAWLGLLPGFGSITVHTAHGEAHLLRPANTDINMPLALALTSFVFVLYFGLKALKFNYLVQYFNVVPLAKGLVQLFKGKVGAGLSGMFLGVIHLFVSVLELLSMFIRIVSFTFRLFGVSTAGEILLLVGIFLSIRVLTEFFYGLELLFGFVQALIFGGLTLIFLTLATAAHGSHEAEEA